MHGTVIEMKVTNAAEEQIGCLFQFGRNGYVSLGLITGVVMVEGDILRHEGGKWLLNESSLNVPADFPKLKKYAEAKAEFDALG